jgi:hypothetical protein
MQRSLFYLRLLGLGAFEIANVYFIMPMPGSQRMDSLPLAYALYTWRWAFRALFGAMVVAGAWREARAARGIRLIGAVAAILAAGTVTWFFNFRLTVERMFREPPAPVYLDRGANQVDLDSLVIGVEISGESRAYPIRYLAYHHQVQDTVAGQPIMVTYCSVCRTGRVFSPIVNGQRERFRLVGMDRFNALFEDATTRSWWRQVSGEAITGPLAGQRLPIVACSQLYLRRWFGLHPNGRVLQPDGTDARFFAGGEAFELGKSRGNLTRTDPGSRQEKSWVVGVETGTASKAYDRNRLKRERVINDTVEGLPIVLALAGDDVTFVAFERPAAEPFTLQEGTLAGSDPRYDLAGRTLGGDGVGPRLRPLRASQEFWHSWHTFHPSTQRDE